jgi:hypothetical protein
MKFVLLALCIGAAFARIEEWQWLNTVAPDSRIEDSAFRPNREYQFFYNGQLASGIAGASKQHSVNRLQALVTISIKSHDKVIMRLQNVRVGQMNREIPNPRKIMPFDAFEDQPLEQHLRQLLEAPVKFSYVHGMVRDVEFDTKEEPWSANVKRGILNLLQVNLQKERRIESSAESTLLNSVRGQRSSAESSEQQPAFYRVMEQTLEGECETLYTIQHQPERRSNQPAMNVTKSINFEKCNKRPQIKYNFRFSSKCPTCDPDYEDDEKFLKSSTVVQYNITGTKDAFMIDMARVESQYVFTPFSEDANVIVTYVNQTLVLIKTGPIRQSQEPQSPIKSDSDMIFSLDWSIAHEKFAMHGSSESTKRILESGAHQGTNKVELAKKLIQKLTTQMKEQVDEEVPRKFSQLVKFLRLCDQQELEQIVQMQDFRQLSPEEEKKVKNVIPQALGACGTKDCVKILSKKIREGTISPVRATLALKGLIHTRVASKDIVNELIQLAESEKSRENEHLKQSAWLTAGSLINALCAENEDQLALEIKEDAKKLCTRELKDSYVKTLFDKLRQSTKWQDKVLMLKTIGNAGLDLSIFELEKIIRQENGQQQPVYARLEAILALRELKDDMPKKIQRVLLPVALNRREYPSIRSMASFMLLQTQPERAILDQLARNLINEPSHQFASFLYTQLETYANSTNPCEEQLSTDATLALRQAKKVSTGLGYSKLAHWTFHCPENDIGLDLDAGVIYSNTSSIPRHMGLSFHSNRWGYWHKHFATLSLFTEGLEPFYRDFMQQRGSFSSQSLSNSLTEILRRHPKRNAQSEENEYERELSQLTRDLKINHRRYEREYESEPKAYFTAMFKSQTVSVLPMGKQLIEELIQNAPARMSDWSQKLQRGLPIEYSTVAQLHEVQLRIPTTLGIPLAVTVEAPMALSIKGKIQANLESIRTKTVKAQAELKPSAVMTFKTEVEAWSPIVVSGVKIQGKAKMFLPIDAKIDIEWNGQEPQIRASIKQPTQKRDLLVLESRPITFVRSWQQFIRNGDEESSSQEVTIFGEETNRVKTSKECYEIANNQVCMNKYVQNVQAQRPKGTPFALFAGQNKLTVSVKPKQESSTQQDLQIKITSKRSTINGQELHKPQFNILGRNSIFDQASSSSESSSEDVSVQGSQETEQQTSEERRREHRRSPQHLARHPSSPTPSSLNRRNTYQQYRDYQIKKGYKTQFDVEVQAQNTRSRLEVSHVYDLKERYGKLQMKWTRQQPEQYQACFDAELMFPEMPQSIRDVQDKKILGHAQLRWGRSSCESQNFVQLTTQAERSQQQIKYEREMSEYKQYRQEQRCNENKAWCSPLTQEDLLEKIGHMLKYRVDIDYQNVPPMVQNYTSKLYRALKYYYYQQTDVDQLNVHNTEGKIRAEMTLDVESKQRVNVTIQTPKETMKIQDLPLSKPMFTLNQKQSFVDQMRNYVDRDDADEDVTECSVTGKPGKPRSQIETFDGTKFTAPFTTCWSVLAKDCSSDKPEFVVMARKSSSAENAKELKIVTRQHRIELKPDTAEYESVKVKVNGRTYDPETEQDIEEHGHVVARVEKEGQSISVELPEVGVEVEFDGYAINVKLSQSYHGQQCGLCGHYDREEADEFRNPDFTEEKDIRQFYMNYLVKDSSCQAPRQLSEVCESEECDKSSASSSSSSSSSQDEDDGDNDETTEKPDSRTKVIEMDDQICFSMQSVLQCDDNSYASEIKEQKQVQYACFDQDSEEAEDYERRARYNKKSLPQFTGRQPNFTRTESIPSKCQKYRS